MISTEGYIFFHLSRNNWLQFLDKEKIFVRNTPLSDLERVEGNENAAQTTYGDLITLFFFVKIINSKERRPINEKSKTENKKLCYR